MIRHLIEPVTGGVVTTKDPLYLEKGELAAGYQCYYTSQDDMLVKVPTISSATASASACTGLEHIVFQDSECLLSHGAGAYYKAPINGADGALTAWSVVASSLSVTSIPDYFTAIQYNDKYVLLDGLNTNQVLLSDYSTRRLGLLPVITPPTCATASASANFPGGDIGYYDYWYTEVAERGGSPEDIIIESSYESTINTDIDGSPALSTGNSITANGSPTKILVGSVNVTTLATKVYVDLPVVPRNKDEATHYYVYRSQPKDYDTETAFPVGQRIARVAVATASDDPRIINNHIRIEDGVVTESGAFYPTTYVSYSGAASNTWADASRVACSNSTNYSDGSYARFTCTPSTVDSIILANQLVLSTINATGIYDPVSQLKFTFRARRGGGWQGCNINVRISGDGGISWGGPVSFAVTATAFADHSTPWANWGNSNLSTTDINNSNFRLRIDVSGYRPSGSDGTLDIDGCYVQIRHNGTKPIPVAPYPGIVLQVGQDQYVTSKGGAPPIASVGCMFQGALVTNDINNKNMVRWSFAGEIDAFPALYFFPIAAPKGSSEITYLGTVNNVCIVGTKSAIGRINFLPTENDSGFGRERIYDFISTDVGIINPKAATVYRTSDGREIMAFIGQDGIHVTDGFTVHKVSTDYNFSALVNSMTSLGASIYSPARVALFNELHSGNLFLYYYTDSGYIVPMNYSQRHIKEGGRLKVGGTWELGQVFKTLTMLRTSLGYPVVYLLDTNSVTYNIKPLSTNAFDGTFSATTRYITVSQPPSEYELKQMYIYGKAGGITGVYSNVYAHRTEKAISTITSSTTSSTTSIGKVSANTSGEMMQVRLLGPADTSRTRLGHIVLEYDDQLGDESD